MQVAGGGGCKTVFVLAWRASRKKKQKTKKKLKTSAHFVETKQKIIDVLNMKRKKKRTPIKNKFCKRNGRTNE